MAVSSFEKRILSYKNSVEISETNARLYTICEQEGSFVWVKPIDVGDKPYIIDRKDFLDLASRRRVIPAPDASDLLRFLAIDAHNEKAKDISIPTVVCAVFNIADWIYENLIRGKEVKKKPESQKTPKIFGVETIPESKYTRSIVDEFVTSGFQQEYSTSSTYDPFREEASRSHIINIDGRSVDRRYFLSISPALVYSPREDRFYTSTRNGYIGYSGGEVDKLTRHVYSTPFNVTKQKFNFFRTVFTGDTIVRDPHVDFVMPFRHGNLTVRIYVSQEEIGDYLPREEDEN